MAAVRWVLFVPGGYTRPRARFDTSLAPSSGLGSWVGCAGQAWLLAWLWVIRSPRHESDPDRCVRLLLLAFFSYLLFLHSRFRRFLAVFVPSRVPLLCRSASTSRNATNRDVPSAQLSACAARQRRFLRVQGDAQAARQRTGPLSLRKRASKCQEQCLSLQLFCRQNVGLDLSKSLVTVVKFRVQESQIRTREKRMAEGRTKSVSRDVRPC